MGAQEHIRDFGKENYRHLESVRGLRRAAWNDESLDPLARTVLGLTGSAEWLSKYEAVARKVGSAIGQPVIEVTEVFEQGPREIRNAKAGIISGEAYIQSSSLDQVRGSGHMSLVAPIVSVVSYHAASRYSQRREQFYTGEDIKEHFIELAHPINCEWVNITRDPASDFYDNCTVPLIGRAEIYKSELFDKGVSKVLLALEEHSASQVATVL